ncbi:MAG: hypothetical protein HPAVJP_5300 [Candidatus Hepatoplasma vulgare]|nr:MAG: hypothetical protein HPAVJP_5300 [Candidatus Hepatoplasma sp.]
MNNVREVSFVYFKKLFSYKNIIFFILCFFLFWTLYSSIISISKYEYAQDPDAHTLIIDKWRMRILVYGIYSTFIVNYSYLFLKKNNFKQINSFRNTISNVMITIFLFILIWFIFIIFMLVQMEPYKYYPDNGLVTYDYKIIMYLLIMMMGFNLVSLFIISIIAENTKNIEKYNSFYYIFILTIVVIQAIFFLYILEILGLADGDETLHKFNLISKSFILSIIILFLLNILNRSVRRRYYKE